MKKQFGASSDVVSNFLRLICDYGHNKYGVLFTV